MTIPKMKGPMTARRRPQRSEKWPKTMPPMIAPTAEKDLPGEGIYQLLGSKERPPVAQGKIPYIM
jgi:hypothetical protein